MSITSLISPQLPLLRRYARAVSGSQASGDNHVVAMLESLLADPASFDRSLDPRVAAYRLFSRIWNANPMNQVKLPRRPSRGRRSGGWRRLPLPPARRFC